MIYAVIDTNVIVSSLLSRKIDTGTVLIRKHILDGIIVPVFNEEIFQEYEDVLHRAKFNLPADAVESILDAIVELGVTMGRTPTTENFPDPKDIVFIETEPKMQIRAHSVPGCDACR